MSYQCRNKSSYRLSYLIITIPSIDYFSQFSFDIDFLFKIVMPKLRAITLHIYVKDRNMKNKHEKIFN